MREIPAQPSSQELAQSLQALGLNFVRSAPASVGSPSQHPAHLISALAQSPEARLRLALIPLFLTYPAWAELLPPLAHDLPPAPRLTLQCYYTAAVWLQQENRPLLEQLLGAQPSLPDHFSSQLGIEKTTLPGENLARLAPSPAHPQRSPSQLAGNLSPRLPGLAQKPRSQHLSRVKMNMDAAQIRQILQFLGEKAPPQSQLFLIGGSALALLGSPRPTLDIDFIGDDLAPDPFHRALLQMAQELHVYMEAIPLERFIPLPQDSETRNILIGQFGNLEVLVVDPYSIAISKVERGLAHFQELKRRLES